jgi:hypothetical protein
MKLLFIGIIFYLLSAINALAWDNKVTHPDLSTIAAGLSFDVNSDFWNEYVNGQSVAYWIRYGAEHEDDGFQLNFSNPSVFLPRYLNHFHAPTRSLDSAGLDDTVLNTLLGGISSVIWAQDPADQAGVIGGDWSWNAVRTYYYNYLTANTGAAEQANLANMLIGLGHQMHLIQDMSQPDHVRNNTHLVDGTGFLWGLETWAKNNSGIINSFAQGPIPDVIVDLTQSFIGTTTRQVTLGPVANLIDTRNYYSDLTTFIPSTATNLGLSEYTNSNFFSHSTIFAADRFSPGDDYYFPNPTTTSTDLQSFINKTKPSNLITVNNNVVDQSNYISKTSRGEILTYLTRQGVSTRFIQSVLGISRAFYWSFKLDDTCYYNYSQKLIPMAVAYSKAMLDYFFRGELTVTVPPNIPPTYSNITLNIHNSTPTGETMDAGSLELMVIYHQYTLGAGTLVSDQAWHYKHYIASGNACTTGNPCAIGTTDTSFNFVPDPTDTSGPIPPLAGDISLVVVYRGSLGIAGQGVEKDAVVYEEIGVNGIGGDLSLSLPSTGVYSAVSGAGESNTFTNFAIAAQNNSINSINPGSSQMIVIYRPGDPLQPRPDNYMNLAVNYVSATIPDPDQKGFFAKTDLPFSLTSGMQVAATDVYAYVIHTDNNGTVTYGFKDISEPTPVDVFNDADYICVNSQWYVAGGPNAIDLANPNNDGNYLFDPYAYNINNIYFKAMSATDSSPASATNYTLQSTSTLPGGSFLRLGYILTDYNFKYSFDQNWLDADQADPFEEVEPAEFYPGTAVMNQTDLNGNYSYPAMYNMRGNLMWGVSGIVYDNSAYPSNSVCSWSTIPQPQ